MSKWCLSLPVEVLIEFHLACWDHFIIGVKVIKVIKNENWGLNLFFNKFK